MTVIFVEGNMFSLPRYHSKKKKKNHHFEWQ